MARSRPPSTDQPDATSSVANPASGEAFKTGGAFEAMSAEHRGPRLTGQRLGDYQLDVLLGKGGMAEVYRAHRLDADFDRAFAVKVFDDRFAERTSRQRFTQERQILALLNHPGIASLVDGGQSDSGLSYLVMELIDGLPIDAYCDSKELSIEERVRLILKVVEAVQYAHSQLIVHRDIKPRNILVDQNGVVKLLDFGIAKIVGDRSHDFDTPDTATGMRLATLRYAAPEQLRQEVIGSFTDIYQLGVLCYRVLTGTHPFEMSDRSLGEVESEICSLPPLAPSKQLRNLDEKQSEIVCSDRRAPRQALRRKIAGDLDAIVLKCLKKEPKNRYASAAELAFDLIAYLERRPIFARRDHLRYRIGKLLKRNAAIATILAISALTITALTVSYINDLAEERDRASAEAERANAVSKYLETLFLNAAPTTEGGDPPTVVSLIESASETFVESLQSQPEAQRQLALTLGSTLNVLGAEDKAAVLLEPVVDTISQPQTPLEIDLFNVYAYSLVQLGDYDGAFGILERIPDSHDDVERSLSVARTQHSLAMASWYAGQRDEAVSAMSEAYATYVSVRGESHRETLLVLSNLALVHIGLDDARAGEIFVDVEARLIDQFGPNDALLTSVYGNLIAIAMQRGNYEDAVRYADRTLELTALHYPDSPAGMARGKAWKGRALFMAGDLSGSEAELTEAVALNQQQYGKDNVEPYALSLIWLAETHVALGRCDAARAIGVEELEAALVPGMVTAEQLSEMIQSVEACK